MAEPAPRTRQSRVASDSVRLELSSPSSASGASPHATRLAAAGRSPPPHPHSLSPPSQVHRPAQMHQRAAASGSQFDFDPAEHHSSRSPSRYFSLVANAAAASSAAAAASPRGAAAKPASVAHVHVHSSGGLTVSPPSGCCARLLACFRGHRWFWLGVLYFFFFLYMVVIPAVLVLVFYLSPAQMIVAVLFALGLPIVGYQFIHRGEMQRRQAGAARRAERQRTQQQQLQQQQHASGRELRETSMGDPADYAAAIADHDAAAAASLSSLPHDSDPELDDDSHPTEHHPSSHPHRPPLHQRLAHGDSGFKSFWHIVSNHYAYELYQLLLTLVSVGSYLFYTYHLSFTGPDPNAPDAVWGYTLRMGSNASDPDALVAAIQQFVQVEYFLIVSLAFDYLLRLLAAPHKSRRIFNVYSLLDLASFTCVAYVNVFHAEFAPKGVEYNVYLFQGPFRFLRMRRALASLDRPIRRRASATREAEAEASGAASSTAAAVAEKRSHPKAPPLYRLGPLTLTKRTAFLLLLLFKILLFICSAAALVVAFEFPCVSMAPVDLRDTCTTQLQRFHLSVYFVVVSLSTVGYGDVNAVTDVGRMLMTGIIIAALVEVPRQIQNMNDISKEEEEENNRRMQQQQQQQQCNHSHSHSYSQCKAEEHGFGGMDRRSFSRPEESKDSSSSLAPWPVPDSSASTVLPSCLFPALSPPPAAGGVAQGIGLSPAALGAFLVDDRAFLCRWAESVLAVRLASDQALAQKLTQSLTLDVGEGGGTVGQAEAQAARIVQKLFAAGTPPGPQEHVSSPPPPPSGAAALAVALGAAATAPPSSRSPPAGWHA